MQTLAIHKLVLFIALKLALAYFSETYSTAGAIFFIFSGLMDSGVGGQQ